MRQNVGPMGKMMKVRIRQAQMGDEVVLAELNEFVHELHVDHNPSHFKRTKGTEVAQWFRDLLGRSTVRIWLAEEEGLAVGYASAFLHERFVPKNGGPDPAFCPACAPLERRAMT